MVHHLPFFSSILPSMGVFAGTSRPGDSIALFGLLRNSPVAFVCSSACFGVLENHPPGKNRDEVVDSCRVRIVVGEEGCTSGSSWACDSVCSCSFSLTGASFARLGL